VWKQQSWLVISPTRASVPLLTFETRCSSKYLKIQVLFHTKYTVDPLYTPIQFVDAVYSLYILTYYETYTRSREQNEKFFFFNFKARGT
jgi:hypothetical protein